MTANDDDRGIQFHPKWPVLYLTQYIRLTTPTSTLEECRSVVVVVVSTATTIRRRRDHDFCKLKPDAISDTNLK
jgi:hypothetical protein